MYKYNIKMSGNVLVDNHLLICTVLYRFEKGLIITKNMGTVNNYEVYQYLQLQ